MALNIPAEAFTGHTADTSPPAYSSVCWLTVCLQSGAQGSLPKLILWIRTTTPDFFTAVAGLQQAEDISQLLCYSTVCVCRCSESRGLGGEEASPGVTLRLHHRVAQIKVYKQRRSLKVALKPPCRWMWAGTPAAERSLAAVSTGQPRDVTEGRRKTLSPNVPPLAIDVTTCRQRTAMFCWLCRHGEEEEEK